MARYRCIYLCIQHRFGTLNRISRCRCFQRYGDGTLGNTRLDDPYIRWVFVPFYSRSMVFTMPEFLERRYNPQSRTILSVISLISYVLTKVAVTVYAGGLVFQQVFGIKRTLGNRLLLDCRHRSGYTDCALHNLRRNEVGTLYLHPADPPSCC